MTREEQIKEASIDAADYELDNLTGLAFVVSAKADYDNGFTRGFTKGANWADEYPKSPWRPVRPDNLPPVDSKFLVVSDTGHVKVCCMPDKEKIFGRGNLPLNSYLGEICDENGLPRICASEGTRWTHWMLIPKFDEE